MPSIQDICPELFSIVFDFLENPADIRSVALCCKYFHSGCLSTKFAKLKEKFIEKGLLTFQEMNDQYQEFGEEKGELNFQYLKGSTMLLHGTFTSFFQYEIYEESERIQIHFSASGAFHKGKKNRVVGSCRNRNKL